MVQRVRRPHRGTSPSSVTQLPILTALHARFPTLFPHIIHHLSKKVNTLFYILKVSAKDRHRREDGGDSLILLFSYRENVPIHSQ